MSQILDNIPTGMDVHGRDWACLDCGGVYCKDEDATRFDLPDYCPNCGDTPGWKNRKTGRRVPDYSTDGGRSLHTGMERSGGSDDSSQMEGK